MKISPANTWLFLQKLLSHCKDSVINIVVLKDYRSGYDQISYRETQKFLGIDYSNVNVDRHATDSI